MGGRTQGLVLTAVHTFLQQFLSRLLPFVFHLAVKRVISPEDAAISTVHLPLLLAVVTGLCREGARRGCLRAPTERACLRTAQAFLPWTLVASIVCTILFSWRLLHLDNAATQAGHMAAAACVCVALVLDALVDPLYISAVYQGHSGYEMRVEVSAKLLESVVVWVLIVKAAGSGATPALAFAVGYLAYSLVNAFGYLAHFLLLSQSSTASHAAPLRDDSTALNELTGLSSNEFKSTQASQPRKASAEQAYARLFDADAPTMRVSCIFTAQACQKMLLQEATRFSLTMYSERASGIYGEVQNLGSLVVRLVFWPIENAAFRAFSEAPAAESTIRGSQSGSSSPRRLLEHAHIPRMLLLLRIVVLCASLACAFGPNYSFAAIHVLLSHRWSSTVAPTVLAAYCGYLLCLAVNGVCEAYVHATMTAGDLMKSNVAMVSIVIVQAGCIAASQRLGESCVMLVAIDSASMLARIAVACFYMRKWHRHYKGSWFAWVPGPGSMLALAVAAAGTNFSNRLMLSRLTEAQLLERMPSPMLIHIAVGVGALGCVLLCWRRTERQLAQQVLGVLRPHQD